MKGVLCKMIVTSMRCYLNVLTQYMTPETLLNANYYMADIRSPDGTAMLNDCMRYNADGQLVNDTSVMHIIPPSLNQYNIKYGNAELDPTPFMAQVLVSIGESYTDPTDMFLRHLNNTDTMIAAYDFLFGNELRGNKLQIMIFKDDEIVKDYVHIVCGYLSQNFGFDILFIDPMLRPDVKGVVEYHGDKNAAMGIINDIRDAKLLIAFNQAISQSGSHECISNLTVYLNHFNAYQIIHLYELLFPDDPLPPDNYTTDHIKQIIIGRVSERIPKNTNPFNNIFLSEDFIKTLERYEAEAEDFDQDDEY